MGGDGTRKYADDVVAKGTMAYPANKTAVILKRKAAEQGNAEAQTNLGFSYYYDEVAKLIIECERRYPDRPVFLYGLLCLVQTIDFPDR